MAAGVAPDDLDVLPRESELLGGRPIGPLAAEAVFSAAGGTEISIEFELDENDTDRFILIRSPQNSIGGDL